MAARSNVPRWMQPDVGSIKPYEPGYTEQARLALARLLAKTGASNYRANDVSGRVLAGLDFVPFLGGAKGASDTVDAYRSGDVVGGRIGAATTLLGILPGGKAVGKAAGKALKRGAPAVKQYLTDAERKSLAVNYPQVGPPTWQYDKKKDKNFLGKEQTDLEIRLTKERDAVRKDMEKNGYTPMFPVEDRFYADPSNYPMPGDTQVDAMAKSADNAERKRAQFDTPEARSALRGAYDKAKDKPLTKKWYAMGQLENAYISELGEKAGRDAFRRDFAESMAATTGGADPTSNVISAHYGNVMRERKITPGKHAYDYPTPVGGRYITGNMKQYKKMITDGKGISASEQPKRHNFAGNFLGHLNRATIDEQMSSGMTAKKFKAPPGSGGYGAMEAVVIDEAEKIGVPAAELQDVAWAGFKGKPGKPMIEHYNDAIERTARITGLPREEVLRRFIRREMPMYGAGGTAVGLGLLMPNQDSENRS